MLELQQSFNIHKEQQCIKADVIIIYRQNEFGQNLLFFNL